MINNLFKLGKKSLLVVSVLSFSTHATITKTFTINEDTRDTHSIFDVSFFNSSSEIIGITKHPSNGNLLAMGKLVSYTPKLNFCGTDTVSYKVRTYFGDTIITPIEPIEPGDPILMPYAQPKELNTYSLNLSNYNAGYSDTSVNINYSITCIDDAPTIDFIPNQKLDLNAGNVVMVTIRDPDSSALELKVTTNSNPSVLSLSYKPTQANYWTGREYVNIWSVYLNPVQNQTGNSIVGIQARSGSAYSQVRNFTVSVGNVKGVVYVHTDLLGSPAVESN